MKKRKTAPKRLSLADIAEKLGISKGAVSLALNDSDKVSKSTKEKVVKLAQKLGYQKNVLLSRVMSNMKAPDSKQFFETIVLINANKDVDAPSKFPIFSKYIQGINIEAEKLGYSVYQVWLHDKSLTPEKLRGILDSRGIRGGIIIGHGDDNILPDTFSEIWKNFQFVSAGLRTCNPLFDCISADKFLIAHHATQKVIESGYKKPAIILDKHIDELVEGRFVGGFLRAQLALPESSRVPPFLQVEEAKKDPSIFLNWLKKHKPDAVFSISAATNIWLDSKEISSKIPKDISVIEFERMSEKGIWQGIDENYETVGRLATRKLFEILNAPVYIRHTSVLTATIVPPKWSD